MTRRRDSLRRTGVGGLLDQAAILLSGLCLVHCAGSAVIVALVATSGSALVDHGVHEVGLAVALFLGAAALGTGLWRHGAIVPLIVGSVGLSLMALALTLPHGGAEMAATMAGVTILAFGHHLNRRASAAALA